jgi:hypothetical protein
MTFGEARPTSQADDDRQANFDRRELGFLPVDWLYRHSGIMANWEVWEKMIREKEEHDAREKTWRELESLRREAMAAQKPKPAPKKKWPRQTYPTYPTYPAYKPPQTWGSEFDPITVEPKRSPYIYGSGNAKPPAWGPVDDLSLPVDMRVPRVPYLRMVNTIMREWDVTTEGEFDFLQPRIVRYALNRMGLLPLWQMPCVPTLENSSNDSANSSTPPSETTANAEAPICDEPMKPTRTPEEEANEWASRITGLISTGQYEKATQILEVFIEEIERRKKNETPENP